MECEICGAETDKLFEIEIEGATMQACEVCSRGKHIVNEIDNGEKKPERQGRQERAKAEELDDADRAHAGIEIIDEYGIVIRKAREQSGLSLEDLGKKINEKESLLRRIEEGKTLPEDKVIKKLEKEFGIKLTAKSSPVSEVRNYGRKEPLTLWDAAEKKSKGRNEKAEAKEEE